MTAGAMPAVRPCSSCPYVKSTPPGVWVDEEYEKLPGYDGETWEQSLGAFSCHQTPEDLCAGWVAVIDVENSLAVRLGIMAGTVSPEVYDWVLPDGVEVFASGSEAAAHGKSWIEAGILSDEALDLIERVGRKVRRRR